MPAAKICFVGLENLPVLCPEFDRHGIGGEQVQQTLLARAFVRDGWLVSMVCLDYGQPDGADYGGIKVYRTFRADAGIPGVRFLHPRLTGLWSALGRADADLYYTSCAGMPVGAIAYFARRHRRRLVFRIAHDTDCDPRRVLIKYRRDRLIYAYGLRHADRVLSQSEQQVAALAANYGVQSTIAGMLVEPPERDLIFDDRDIDVLWVNNLRPFKRPDLVLELARKLPDLTFHMIGGPQPPYESLYQETTAAACTIPNLKFHGRIPYHGVNTFYERARVFVNTSDSEGFPNSYLQAWRRGTPLVTFFDPDGIVRRHALGHTAAGLTDMTAAIRVLARERESWHTASEACRRFMADRYGDASVLAEYRRVFESVLH
ncbi:MAG: glycosyltransferase family 4 protein [Candidatus Krumholzibacteria bacterium]|nr:glycosyltransferase family 4 protein [Candidatus Krumholzibacteria bacterium]